MVVVSWPVRSTRWPRSKRAPARTRATRGGALTARQRVWAASISLNAIARPAALEPGPLVTLVRCRTVAKVDSIGFVPGMKSGGGPCVVPLLPAANGRAYGVTVREQGPSGNTYGQAVVFGGLRARVSSWPPLR